MRNHYLAFGLLLSLFSCTEGNTLDIIEKSEKNAPTTRSAGDGEYDVLGYGYDVTGEYLHPMSVKNPVLDIKKYEQDHKGRVISGTPSFGYDKMHYGYSALDYTKDITNSTNVDTNFNTEKGSAKFSGSITSNNYFKTLYSYSSKYSFASLDAVRNRKYIRINDEVNRLSQYLSEEFKEDLNRLSADRIVERYGTNVLTDFIIGGRYKLMFSSVITTTTDTSNKRNIVKSGFNATLKKIGFGINADHTVQVDETIVNENQNKVLYVMFYGGNGTSTQYNLEKGLPTTIDIKSWEDAVKLDNANLTDINWTETFPIYDFISDPVKKEAIKNAVAKYIDSKKLKVLATVPLFQYSRKGSFHYNTQLYSLGWNREGVAAYVLSNKSDDFAVPLYQFERNGEFHYNTNSYSLGWRNGGITCYVFR